MVYEAKMFNEKEYEMNKVNEREYRMDYQMTKIGVLINKPLFWLWRKISPKTFRTITRNLYTTLGEKQALKDIMGKK